MALRRTPTDEARCAEVLARDPIDRDEIARLLMTIASVEIGKLPSRLRCAAEDEVGRVVLSLMENEAEALRRRRAGRQVAAYVRTWLRNFASNAARAARRVHSATARAKLASQASPWTLADRIREAAIALDAERRTLVAALTRRQRDVLALIERGEGWKRIAAKLRIDRKTVREHAESIVRRFRRKLPQNAALGNAVGIRTRRRPAPHHRPDDVIAPDSRPATRPDGRPV